MKLLYKPRKRTNITEESQVIEKAKKDFIQLMNISSFGAQIPYVDSFLRIAFQLGWLDKYRNVISMRQMESYE
jgi:hypothetical protein